MVEHLQGLNNSVPSCPLHKHAVQDHQGDTGAPKFTAKVLGTARTNLTRLILEAEEIQEGSRRGKLLNSKSEFRGTKIVRMVPQVERM